MVEKIDSEHFSVSVTKVPEKGKAKRHESLKNAIGTIVPNNTNENSQAFLSFLAGEQANLTGPDQKRMKTMVNDLRGGDMNSFEVMNHYLNSPDEQAASIRNHLEIKLSFGLQ